MAEHLASVPEETTTGFPAPCPPPNSYVESLQIVDAPQWRIRSTLFPQSSHSESSYSSSYSTSYSGGSSSNISGCSSGLVSAGAWDFDFVNRKIAQNMVSNGYVEQMVQAFGSQNPDSVLEAWLVELGVAWVLKRRESHGSQFPLQPQKLVDMWIRSLTITVVSIKELVTTGHEMLAVAPFGKASISAILDFIHILNLPIAEKLQAMLLMYICVSSASYDMNTLVQFSSSEAKSIFSEIGHLLKRKENMLTEDTKGMIKEAKVKAFSNVDDSWDIEILRGRGEVHQSVRLLTDCVVSMKNAHALSLHYAQNRSTKKLRDLIDDTMGYLKNMLQEKSELCLDPSLRYIFLLNNSNFVAHLSESSISLDIQLLSVHHKGLELLTPECKKHMDSYLKVSWGHVLSFISTSKNSGPLRRWNINSSHAKFQSAFHKTYKAQKFWKVPDPVLRSLLREEITKRVISAYRTYMKEHPELEKHSSGTSSSPDVLEEMVGELFEG